MSATRRRGSGIWPKATGHSPENVWQPRCSSTTPPGTCCSWTPPTSPDGTFLAAWPKPTSRPCMLPDGNYTRNSACPWTAWRCCAWTGWHRTAPGTTCWCSSSTVALAGASRWWTSRRHRDRRRQRTDRSRCPPHVLAAGQFHQRGAYFLDGGLDVVDTQHGKGEVVDAGTLGVVAQRGVDEQGVQGVVGVVAADGVSRGRTPVHGVLPEPG